MESSMVLKDGQKVGFDEMVSAIRGHSPYFITRWVKIIEDSISFLLPYACHVSILAEKTLVHNKYLCFFARQLVFFLGFQ